MNLPSLVTTNLTTVTAILGAMALVALLETGIPLHARDERHRSHLGPNLALTFITFATNMLFNVALLLALALLRAKGLGILRWLGLGPFASAIAAVVLLDFSFYLAHVAMHKVPALWRFHRVHHSDPVVDVTTTIRQHPGEGLIRYAFLGLWACALGVGLRAYAVYRLWSVINGLLEHANIRVSRRLDRALSLVTTWPNMHKIHHSREASETDSNYGNIFSWFDRLFATYTPSWRGAAVVAGLDGHDDPALQTTAGLLAMPFQRAPRSASDASAAGERPPLGRGLSASGR